MGQAKDLTNFAVNETPKFFTNNLEGLKNNSSEDLKKILNYENTVTDINKKFAEVGAIKNCVQEKEDSSDVNYGFDISLNNKVEVGLTGNYSVRCYGEKKPWDIYVDVKRENSKWVVDNYQFDLKLENQFDSNSKDNETNNSAE